MSRVALRRRGIAAKSLSSGTLTAAQEFTRREALTIGSYQPDDSNTGLLTSTTGFTTINTDPFIITTAGQTVQDSIINGRVTVRAANVTLKNCWIRGPVTPANDGQGIVDCAEALVSNCLITDCLISPQTPSWWLDGIRGWKFTARRNIVEAVTDGMGFNAPTTQATAVDLQILCEGNWIRDMAKWWPGDRATTADGTHNDGIQIHGNTGITIRGNRFDGRINQTIGDTGGFQTLNGGQVTTSQQVTSLVMLSTIGNPVSNILIEDNWFYGATAAINGRGIETGNIGTIQRNKFDRAAAVQVTIDPTPTVTYPTSGVNANTYLDNGAVVPLDRTE